MNLKGCFRPLSGSYISQYISHSQFCFYFRVSVPYRGATFLNNALMTLGIFLWIVSVPYRGATFLNIQFEELAKGYEAVSVPYRGATFLNKAQSSELFEESVSVPYRGATFLNEASEIVKDEEKIVSVPYRGATFLNKHCIYSHLRNFLVSVPYRGATFLNCLLPSIISKLVISFPSPIGELHFSIGRACARKTIRDQRFRPLSGSYISQYYGWIIKTVCG